MDPDIETLPRTMYDMANVEADPVILQEIVLDNVRTVDSVMWSII